MSRRLRLWFFALLVTAMVAAPALVAHAAEDGQTTSNFRACTDAGFYAEIAGHDSALTYRCRSAVVAGMLVMPWEGLTCEEARLESRLWVDGYPEAPSSVITRCLPGPVSVSTMPAPAVPSGPTAVQGTVAIGDDQWGTILSIGVGMLVLVFVAGIFAFGALR